MEIQLFIALFIGIIILWLLHDYTITRQHAWRLYKLDKILERLETIEVRTDAYFPNRLQSIVWLLKVYAPDEVRDEAYYRWAMRIFEPTLNVYRNSTFTPDKSIVGADRTLWPNARGKKAHDKRQLEIEKSTARTVVLRAPEKMVPQMEKMPEERLLQLVRALAKVHGELLLSPRDIAELKIDWRGVD